MQIELDRVTVRPFAPEDAADLWEILGDAQTMAYLERPYDFPGTQAFLQDFCIARKGALACVCRETGKVIGYLLFHALQSGVYELGWAFNRRFWRQGYAFEALDGLIAYAFEKLGAHKVFAETIDTVRSVGLMRKLGMRREGVQRAQTQDSNGAWTDLYLYGMTCGDYWAGRPRSGDKEEAGAEKAF